MTQWIAFSLLAVTSFSMYTILIKYLNKYVNINFSNIIIYNLSWFYLLILNIYFETTVLPYTYLFFLSAIFSILAIITNNHSYNCIKDSPIVNTISKMDIIPTSIISYIFYDSSSLYIGIITTGGVIIGYWFVFKYKQQSAAIQLDGARDQLLPEDDLEQQNQPFIPFDQRPTISAMPYDPTLDAVYLILISVLFVTLREISWKALVSSNNPTDIFFCFIL